MWYRRSVNEAAPDSVMAKPLSARKRLEGIALFLDAIRTPKTAAPSPERNGKKARNIAKLERELDRSLMKAYEKLKLDPNSDDDGRQLCVWLAWAVYGGKEPGAPLKWPPKECRRLLADVNALRAENPKLKETECCELLCKGKAGGGRYEGLKSSTLRRRLQIAKALQQQAEVLSTRGHLRTSGGAGPS
jgi:hypothetical protein